MKQYHPGEYAHKWRGVSSNREFLKGAPIGDLIEDVKTRGVQNPVKVYKDTVVDGHHRVVAAAVAGKEIPFEEVEDSSYEDQHRVARSARLRGSSALMPSSAPQARSLMPDSLKQYLGYK
jgi:hypothetical protein